MTLSPLPITLKVILFCYQFLNQNVENFRMQTNPTTYGFSTRTKGVEMENYECLHKNKE